MIVDIIAGIIVLFFGFTGYVNGAMLQVVQAGLLVGSFFLARVVGAATAGLFGKMMSIEPRYAGYVSLLICWVLLYLVLRLFFAGLIERWKNSRLKSGGLDRLLGGLLGLAKGAVGIYLGLSALTLANKAFARKMPGLWVHYSASRVGRWVEENNLFDKVPDTRMQALAKLVRLATDPEVRDRMAFDPAYRAAMERVGEHVLKAYPDIFERLQKGDIAGLAADPRLADLLADPEFVRLLDSVASMDPDKVKDPRIDDFGY